MELTITKEKVLEAASKCSTAKATLKVLFPEVFETEGPKINNAGIRVDNENGFGNLYLRDEATGYLLIGTADGVAPEGLVHKCFFLGDNLKWEVRQYGNNTFLIPTYKK